jgi:signal transduction histidine kinase
MAGEQHYQKPENGDPGSGDYPGHMDTPAPQTADSVRREARILIAEDSAWDAKLAQRLLAGADRDFTCVIVCTRAAFMQELAAFRPDIILSDFDLPGFSGLDILKIAQEQSPGVPFVFWTGVLGDETAVSLIRQGATDYVLKDKPARLPSVICRALAEAEQRTHLAQLENQLVEAQRMESLGQLAGGIAHDFNNLLAVILNYVSFVSDEITAAAGPAVAPHLEPASADLAQIKKAAERAAELTHQLLVFARREVVRPRVLSLDSVVSAVEDMLRRTLGEHIEFVIRLAGDLWPVLADPGQLERALVNLAINARDAMPDGGTLTIDTANIITDAGAIAGVPGALPERKARMRVSDTGTGIPADVVPHIFEPFFTTKPKGDGTGLGLATVYGIISQAGGTIHVSSTSSRGTTFTLMLPVTTEEAVVIVEPAPYLRVPKGETVLVVEDQAALREAASRILTCAGYRVIAAASGPEAIEIARRHQGTIHLLVTDVVMPHMLGKEVAERIKGIVPDINVLFMSGYTGPVLASQGRLDPGVALVQKPFSEAGLLAMAGQVLDGHFVG